jgi:hypothetical protein
MTKHNIETRIRRRSVNITPRSSRRRILLSEREINGLDKVNAPFKETTAKYYYLTFNLIYLRYRPE